MDCDQIGLKVIFATIVAYLSPVEGPLTALVAVLSLNMFIGIGVGIGIQGEKLQFKKAFWAFFESAVIAALIAFVYYIAEKNGDLQEGIKITSYMVYVAVILYGQNIVKNLLRVWPKNRFLLVLNYFLSAEFLRILSKIKERGENREPEQEQDQDQDQGRNYRYNRNREYYEEQ